MAGHTGKSRSLRNFLFSSVTREFLIFLFFLVISAIFWLLMTLNETYEREYRIAVRVTGVPKNVVLTSDETDTIRITLKDKGLILMGYVYGEGLHPVSVDFTTYAGDKGHGSVPSADIMKMLTDQVAASTKIVSAKPDALEFSFNYGESKRVAVRWQGEVTPEHLYFIAHTEYSPDSVTVYAPQEKLDSMTTVYTEKLNISNFRDSLSVDCQIAKMTDVKVVPSRVNVTFFTDLLTEESVGDIPIEGINMPEGKVLRTFPSKVAVKFVTGISQFKSLNTNDFKVVADYNDIAGGNSDKCPLVLQSVPRGISRPTLSIEAVDYLIEDIQSDTTVTPTPEEAIALERHQATAMTEETGIKQ